MGTLRDLISYSKANLKEKDAIFESFLLSIPT